MADSQLPTSDDMSEEKFQIDIVSDVV